MFARIALCLTPGYAGRGGKFSTRAAVLSFWAQADREDENRQPCGTRRTRPQRHKFKLSSFASRRMTVWIYATNMLGATLAHPDARTGGNHALTPSNPLRLCSLYRCKASSMMGYASLAGWISSTSTDLPSSCL
jgi:hypothetical protein